MNQISPYVKNLIGNASKIAQSGLNKTSEWLGHGVSLIQSIPLQMQNNTRIAYGVIAAANSLFFLVMSLALHHMDRRLENQNNPLNNDQRTFKAILLNGVVLGGFAGLFNVGLSKITRYPLAHSTIAAIAGTMIATRILCTVIGKCFAKKSSKNEKKENAIKTNSPKIPNVPLIDVEDNQRTDKETRNQKDVRSKQEGQSEDNGNSRASKPAERTNASVSNAVPPLKEAERPTERVKIIDKRPEKREVPPTPSNSTNETQAPPTASKNNPAEKGKGEIMVVAQREEQIDPKEAALQQLLEKMESVMKRQVKVDREVKDLMKMFKNEMKSFKKNQEGKKTIKMIEDGITPKMKGGPLQLKMEALGEQPISEKQGQLVVYNPNSSLNPMQATQNSSSLKMGPFLPSKAPPGVPNLIFNYLKSQPLNPFMKKMPTAAKSTTVEANKPASTKSDEVLLMYDL